MAITTQPYYSVLPAYRPVKFLCTLTEDPTAYLVENAVVEIYKNAVLLTTVRYKVAYTTPATPPDTNYFFEIDIQKYCQDSLTPNTESAVQTVFAGAGVGIVECVDAYANYYIIVTYEAIDPTTGLLIAVPAVTDTSDDFTVISSSKQHGEAMDLFYYYGTDGMQDGHCLTKSSEVLSICSSENAYLVYINPDPKGKNRWVRVLLFDSGGTQLSGAVGNFSDAGALTTPTLLAMNVGIDSLKSTSYTSGSVDFTDPDLAYYTVSFGFGIPSFSQHTNEFTYQIENDCCGKNTLRLHWLNLLGGVDSYTFNSEKELRLKSNSERGTKALDWLIGSASPNSNENFGGYKYNSKGMQSYRLVSRFLTNTEATWLSELLTSPTVYAEIDGAMIPVVIEDTEQTISRARGKIQFEINVTLANDLIIQRV